MINNDSNNSHEQQSNRPRFKPTLHLLVPFLMIGLYQNCSPSSGSSSGSSSTSASSVGGSGSGGSGTTGVALQQSDLQGTWNQACTSYAIGGYSANTTQTLTVSASTYSISAKVYLGGCTGTPSGVVTVHGSYTLGGLASAPSGATQINFSESSATLTPGSTIAAFELNEVAACGITNWANNVATTITGVSGCDPSASNSSELYSVAEIKSSALYLGGVPLSGDGNVGSTSSLRLDTLGTTGYTH